MDTAILSLHVLVCIVLIILVLLQAGREGMGVIFGGGSSSTFGTSGAGNLLTKLTAVLAIIFVCTSLAYNIATSTADDVESTILDVQFEEVPVTIPATPADSAPAVVPAPEASPAE